MTRNSSNVSISLRWGLAGASVWTLGVSNTLCGVVWYQRMYLWCRTQEKSKVPAVPDHCCCIYLLQSDWHSWARLCCHYLCMHWSHPAQSGPSAVEILWWWYLVDYRSCPWCDQGPWGLGCIHSIDYTGPSVVLSCKESRCSVAELPSRTLLSSMGQHLIGRGLLSLRQVVAVQWGKITSSTIRNDPWCPAICQFSLGL